jgi:hypothetical protein
MANLFDKVKKIFGNKKVEKHEVVNLPELAKELKELEKIDSKLEGLTKRRELIRKVLVSSGKKAMVNLYDETNIFPGTVKIVAKSRSFQFITSDRYSEIDENRFKELTKKFSNEIAEEKTTYSFNNEILQKYKDVISDLLLKSKKIKDEDKEKLLTSHTIYMVKKGTINKLAKFASDCKTTIAKMVDEISPIFSIKSTK